MKIPTAHKLMGFSCVAHYGILWGLNCFKMSKWAKMVRLGLITYFFVIKNQIPIPMWRVTKGWCCRKAHVNGGRSERNAHAVIGVRTHTGVHRSLITDISLHWFISINNYFATHLLFWMVFSINYTFFSEWVIYKLHT